MNLFDLYPEAYPKLRTLNDYFESEALGKPIRLNSTELQIAQEELGDNCSWYFYVTRNKCCGCYPMLKQTNHLHKPLAYLECIVCGRKTKPVDDYSWIHTKKAWDALFGDIRDEILEYRGTVFQFLRYGPKGVSATLAEKARMYIEKYGIPEEITWDKESLPCFNCEHCDGKKCKCKGGPTVRYEYGYRVCDNFKLTIEMPMAKELRFKGYENCYDSLPDHDCDVEMVDVHEYPRYHMVKAKFNAASKTFTVGSYGWPLKWWKEIPESNKKSNI